MELGKQVTEVTLSATVSKDKRSTLIHGNAPVKGVTISFPCCRPMTYPGPGLREIRRRSQPDRMQTESDRSGFQKKELETAVQTEQKELGQRSSDSSQSREIRQSRRSSDSGRVTASRAGRSDRAEGARTARRAGRSDRAEGARTAVEGQAAEQGDQTEQKELGQRLRDSPQSREIRRSSNSGRVTASRAGRSDRAEGARTEVE
jgi:hypothetical protein